jgi:hypothetical protein
MQNLVATTPTMGRLARAEMLALAELRGHREEPTTLEAPTVGSEPSRSRTVELVRTRFARYPFVARRFDRDGLAAFLLFDRVERANERTLLYLGPLVSRDSAYLPLFAGLVDGWIHEPLGFWALAELESTRVHTSFHAVLPSFVISDQSAPEVRHHAAAVVDSFVRAFPHIHDFDPESFTTRRDEATSAFDDEVSGSHVASREVGASLAEPRAIGRYRVALFGCEPRTRRALIRELHTNVDAPLRRIA